jgi:hypothetical protein
MSEQVRVALSDILEGLEFQSDEFSAYLHRPTGRVIMVSDEALRAAEEGLEGEDAGVEEVELVEARAILAGGDDYLSLPDRFDIDEYRMMERFAASIADPTAQEEVLSVLRGKGAFRRFKDAVGRLGLADDWYVWRDHGYEEIARDWCDAHGIALAPPAADV